MEPLTKACWLILAAIHAMPAAVLFSPGLAANLYDAPPQGSAGLLLTHRAAMFLGVLAVALLAAASPAARPAATLVLGASMLGFLAVYAVHGLPPGPLRMVAVVDAAALPALAFVAWAAWRRVQP